MNPPLWIRIKAAITAFKLQSVEVTYSKPHVVGIPYLGLGDCYLSYKRLGDDREPDCNGKYDCCVGRFRVKVTVELDTEDVELCPMHQKKEYGKTFSPKELKIKS